MKYYTAEKKRRNSYLLRQHGWTWRLSEIMLISLIMLSEISQLVKDKYHMISLRRGI